MKKVVCFMLLLLCLIPYDVLAHPGRTDDNGCHTCKTNCSKWGLSEGEYHCHNGSSSSSSSSNSSQSSVRSAPKYVYGCMDQNAINYDMGANINNDSCQYKKVVTEKEPISFKTKYKENAKMILGEEKVITKGTAGKKGISYEVITGKDGKVMLDGYDIKTLTRYSIRDNIFLITQNPYIFNFSIKENLLLEKKMPLKKKL